MGKILNGYMTAMDVLEKICSVFIVLALIAMTVIMSVQTIMRYFFATGLTWSEELTRLICCYSVMIASNVAIRHGRHLNMGFIADRLHGRAKGIYKLIIELVCFAFYVYIIFLSFTFIANVTGTTTATHIPFKYVYMCLPLGIGLMIVSSLEQCFLAIWSLVTNEEYDRARYRGEKIRILELCC